ncbi:unnamed protein product [Polarella glacialis]|uniref:50S ribosomal protein L12, chloroplastic n=1 Tax=Polarella glacialis TaxID=89957 RepID=A0A813FBE1_POLGL|nr:unnamed protein product [Polarella glacialis]CAE8717177.1 unnamed protein product [Polarella glacialis]
MEPVSIFRPAPASSMARRSRPVLLLALVGACALLRSSLSFVSGTSLRGSSMRAPTVAMESAKVDAIIEEMKSLTLLEASELVKEIETTFGVDASSGGGGMMMMAGPAAGVEEEEKAPEKTEFDVVLKEVPKDKKIAILKVVRTITGMGLKEAKGMVDNPGKVVEKKPKDFCEDAKKQLEEAGAVVALE